MTIFGERSLWAIEVDPLPGGPVEHDPGAAATWCAIRIWAEGKNLTAHTHKPSSRAFDALHWPAVYLARWFVRSWSGLWERAGWPLPGPEIDAESACRRLDQHLGELGVEADDAELDRRDEFVASHSLLAASAGGVMPHVYVMREGSTIHVTWREPVDGGSEVVFHELRGRARVGAEAFLDAVTEFLRWCGDAVAESDSHLAGEIESWLDRIDQPEAAEALLNGYIRPWGVADPSVATNGLVSRLELPDQWQSMGARFNPAQVPAAVVFRALTPVLREDDALALLDRLRSRPPNLRASRALEGLRSALMLPSTELPHEQGYSLAEQFRAGQGNIDAYFDVEGFLAQLGIEIDDEVLADATIDGATVWSAEHGPVIVVNREGIRTQAWARRMTLAHELCHLLVDREAATELMVVSTPWAPPEIERRANAFAAELLLPKAGILRAAGDAVRSGWVGEDSRAALMDEFKVGATVCSHQLENRLRISE